MHSLPFALLESNDEELLLHKFELVMLNNLSSLGKIQNEFVPDSIDLFGGADYNLDQDIKKPHWQALPGTLTEVENIKNLLTSTSNITIFVNEEAKEDALKALDKKASEVLHIATHGFVMRSKSQDNLNGLLQFKFPDNPLERSGLILSGGNYAWENGSWPSQKEDGIVTALEIANLNLSSTKLAVLSACNTGLGIVKGSEGVYGLKRAFQIAQVSSLIISLWEVPDQETVEFMTNFYDNWLQIGHLQNAFSKTQKMMHSKYDSEPHKWAAFILVQ